ncbi:MAG: trypsin-like serine protease [Pseudomonadota bacterium]
MQVFPIALIAVLAMFTLIPSAGESSPFCFDRSTSRQVLLQDSVIEVHNNKTAPWMVSLAGESGDHFCGGVLINTDLVLTAAHCFDEIDTIREFQVRLPDRSGRFKGLKRKPESVAIHGRYDDSTLQFDIAVVFLNRPFLIDTNAVPRMIPMEDAEYWERPGDCAKAFGWGNTSEKGRLSKKLLSVSLPLWRSDECQKVSDWPLYEENLCAGYRAGLIDTCNRDSGGPLMISGGPSGNLIVGIVSTTTGTGGQCARPDKPGIYTKVSSISEWAREAIADFRSNPSNSITRYPENVANE